MASMGLLAAGVAHEINNPLTFVLYNSETLAERLPLLAGAVGRMSKALLEQYGEKAVLDLADDGADLIRPMALSNLAELAAQAVTGTKRINEITRSLSFFSRPERGELSLVDLNTALEQAVKMAENEIKIRAVLTRKFGRVPTVMATIGRLSQVFLNLIVNAAHAIEEGAVKDNHISVRTWSESGRVFAEVLDTGCGIRAADLASVFEPFFTTKGPDRGTGLGLAIARNIVSEFGGDIHIESTLGNGTRVVVSLPVAQAPQQHAPSTSIETPAAMLGARGRILVVDDEEMVRSAVKAILARDHEVVIVDSGRTAREILRHDQSFDLVLCDLMMPDISGIELHAWLSENQPYLARQLVFITGGVFTPLANDYISRVANSVIEKPFDVVALRKFVRERVIAAQARR
jgi:CheY-like chemotaxis protein